MGVNIQTIKDIRLFLSNELKDQYSEEEISSIAGIIIRTITGLSRLHEINNPARQVSAEEAGKVVHYCCQLQTGRPLQYILGETEFYNCRIRLNGSTLIPRPETEELVDLVIKENRDFKGRILDLGTGSGCIAIALALNIKGAEVTGIDISEDAIKISKENALLNNAFVAFETDDILNPGKLTDYKAGIIVSNPPYVRDCEKLLMKRNVLDFEPHQALFVPDSDPLVYYKGIALIAEKILMPGGKIYLEINEALDREMLLLFDSAGYSGLKVIADLSGKQRMMKGIKNG